MTPAHTSALPHILLGNGTVAAASISMGGALVFAVGWLAVCALCALIYWLLMLRIFRRRHGGQPTYRARLFVALFLTAFAGSSLIAADRLGTSVPLLFLPIPGLFLLYFYRLSDGRYTPTWTLWLVFIYGVTQVGSLIPSTSKQSDQQIAQLQAHIPAWIVTLGLDISSVIGNTLLITFIVIGILPQIYMRYRDVRDTGVRRELPQRSWMILGGALAAASFLLLFVSALLTQPPIHISSPIVLGARTGFFVLTTLLPIAASFALLRGRFYDRYALLNRALIYGSLTACLILIYAATTGLTIFIPTLQVSPLILVLVAIDVPLLIALFPVLHAGIQDLINRRFFQSEYMASSILAAYQVTLREETHLVPLAEQLVAAVQKSMQSSFVALWLRTPAAPTGPYVPSMVVPPRHVRRGARREQTVEQPPELRLRHQANTPGAPASAPTLSIAPTDPSRGLLFRVSGAVEVADLPEQSAFAGAMRDSGASVVVPVPLRWHTELAGVLALGPRSSARPYTFDDSELLAMLAEQVSPPLYRAHVAHEQDVEQRQRERVEQELQTARRIQEALLPKAVPALAGWQIATLYQPAREVGGDFYDFLSLADGRLGVVLGDVTDKGIPAALVMATTRSMLRAVAVQPSISPGQVLGQVNELLCPDLPASMFVTCFYAILDPATGHLRFANAGQDFPYLRHCDGSISELQATGMPLGLLPGSPYDEGEATLTPGDSLLFFSDGLVEAHNPQREMFGLPRLETLLREHNDGTPPIVFLLHELAEFTGSGWEQEDDITLVALQRTEKRTEDGGLRMSGSNTTGSVDDAAEESGSGWRALDEWTLASVPGNERQAIARLATAVRDLPLSPARLENLKSAVGEATMNAMEHGNGYQPDRLVALEVRASAAAVSVRITDQGSHVAIPDPQKQAPDLGAKLAGLQSPRGWGLFLIRSLVDEVRVTGDETHHTVELILALDDVEHPAPASEET